MEELTSVEIIAIAIRSEEDAADFYGRVSKMVKNDLVKSKYESLAREEVGHRHMLISLYKKMTGGVNPPKFTQSPTTAEGGIPIAMDNLEDMLKFAIARENEAEKVYGGAAKKCRERETQRIFQYLSGIERGHANALELELEAYCRDKNWYADNPDIQLVGP